MSSSSASALRSTCDSAMALRRRASGLAVVGMRVRQGAAAHGGISEPPFSKQGGLEATAARTSQVKPRVRCAGIHWQGGSRKVHLGPFPWPSGAPQ